MKSVNTLAGLALAAYAVLVLAACSKTNNDSTPAAATPTSCSYVNGQYVNNLGQLCSATGSNQCAGAQYINGQYYINGQPVNCGNNQYVVPPNGQFGGNYYTNCQQYSQYYGITYVPVNVGGGQQMCVRYDYLQQQVNFTQYNSYYSDPNYWYQYPPTVYTGYDYYGSGYGANQCAANISLGFGTGGFGAGLSLCL